MTVNVRSDSVLGNIRHYVSSTIPRQPNPNDVLITVSKLILQPVLVLQPETLCLNEQDRFCSSSIGTQDGSFWTIWSGIEVINFLRDPF